MSIDSVQLRSLIIDVLLDMEDVIPYTDSAVELLMLTAAAETKCGRYVEQVFGPALGIFQMEPYTIGWFLDAWVSKNRPDFLFYLDKYRGNAPIELVMRGNILYQIVLARMYYWSKPFKFTTNDMQYLAQIWKKYWNTFKGKGTVEGALEKYYMYALND